MSIYVESFLINSIKYAKISTEPWNFCKLLGYFQESKIIAKCITKLPTNISVIVRISGLLWVIPIIEIITNNL